MKITVEVSSDTLSDLVAEYLEGACPSALLMRIAKGIQAFEDNESIDKRDRVFVSELRKELDQFSRKWRKMEEDEYAGFDTRIGE